MMKDKIFDNKKSLMINEAYAFAEKKHIGQTRQNGTPYIHHPIQVVEVIKQYFSNHPKIDELMIAGYLHDTIEDTETTIDEIRLQFGHYVAHLVESVTNNEQLKQKMGKTNYLCDKMVNMDEDALNLKLCDRLANVLDLCHASTTFAKKYKKETITIIQFLSNKKPMTDIQKEIIKRIEKELNDLQITK